MISGAGRYLDAARQLAPQIAAGGAQGDRDRRLPRAVVDAMADAGLFRMVLSPAIGGAGAGLIEFLRVTEAVAQADGSAGWCLVQGAISAVQVAPYVPTQVAREIFSSDPRAVLANGTPPGGRAVVAERGYRLTGQWPFASGCTHATWFKGAALVVRPDGSPVAQRDGSQEHRTFLFPAADARILDVWHVSGLRGTGSNTIVVEDLFVPSDRSTCLADDLVRDLSPYALLPYSTLAAAGFCAVALGIARGALDALEQLATVKTPRGEGQLLRDHPRVQALVARVEAQLRTARAFLFETVEDAWSAVERVIGEDKSLAGTNLFSGERAL